MSRTPLLVLVLATASFAQFVESEPNDSKAGANPVSGMMDGNTIAGSTTGTSTTTAGPASADYFLVSTAPLPPAIYQHTLTLTTTTAAVHTMTIRGRNQSGGVIGTADFTMQIAQVSGAGRVARWYGFGRSEQVYIRVSGSALTTAPYTLTLGTATVTPVSGGCFQSGTITLSTVGQTTVDTDLWVYDGSLTAIPGYGNDNEPAPGTTTQSRLVRTYAPGTYYVANSRWDCANNLPSPSDDRSLNGLVTDFPDVHVHGSSTSSWNCNMRITDALATVPAAPVNTPTPNGVAWVAFTVVPAGSGIAWETNEPGMDLDINGVQNTTQAPADVTVCVGSFNTLDIQSTNPAMGWEMAYGSAPGLSGPTPCSPGAGGIPTPNGQVVNIDMSDPSLRFLYQFAYPPFPAGGMTLPFSHSAPLANVSAQAVVFSTGHADGFELSSLTQLHVVHTATIPGPAGDDDVLAMTAGAGPVCAAPAIGLYGTTYTQYFVMSNGRVTLGTSNPTWIVLNPTLTGTPPFAGCHTDFSPPIAGNITIDVGPASIRVDYHGVGYFFQPGTASTFSVTLTATGDVLIDNAGNPLAFGAQNPGGNLNQFLGVHPGGAAGIAAGVPPASWAAGTGYLPVAPSDVVGVFGLAGAGAAVPLVAPGTMSASFTWTAGGYVLNVN